MKNIHLLPTDKPSRLYTNHGQLHLDSIFQQSNGHTVNQHIYITSSDEEIKEDDWFLNETNKVEKAIQFYNYKSLSPDCKKIILTTDEELQKDGVQAIDDEFLEWLCKTPSCEFVEVKKGFADGTAWGYNFLDYKIIIPQEEPKQYPIGGYAPGNYWHLECTTCKKAFFGDKRAVQCEPCAIKMTQENPKQDSVFENAKLVLREHLLENKEQVAKDLQEMKEKSSTNRDETLEEAEENIDREEWINFFKNNSKEEILEYLINYKFPL